VLDEFAEGSSGTRAPLTRPPAPPQHRSRHDGRFHPVVVILGESSANLSLGLLQGCP
jgi:hypothetical protein